MALINCEECGHEISISAESCPQCGHVPQDAKDRKVALIGGLFKAALWFALAFVLLLIAF